MKLYRLFLALLALVAGAAPAAAETYPSRALTMIVPFPAGGATDTVARLLGEHMRAHLGPPVVVENVGGAAGRLGVGRAVRAAPDGYTLSIGTSTTHMLTGGLYVLPYDLFSDLEPIIHIGSEPLLVVARKELPATDLKELIAYLKTNPDKASVGIPGVGSTGHVAGLSFQKLTDTRYQFVPYRGNAPAMQDLVAGQIDFMMEPSSNFLSLVQGDKVKPLALTATTRSSSLPNVPTTAEAGLPAFTASLWYGLWVPKDTPKDIRVQLNAVMVKVLAEPAVQKRFTELGIQMASPAQQTVEAFRAFHRAEAERWWPVIKAANIKAE